MNAWRFLAETSEAPSRSPSGSEPGSDATIISNAAADDRTDCRALVCDDDGQAFNPVAPCVRLALMKHAAVHGRGGATDFVEDTWKRDASRLGTARG